VRKLTK